jgi:hypothetical protein
VQAIEAAPLPREAHVDTHGASEQPSTELVESPVESSRQEKPSDHLPIERLLARFLK